MRTLIIISTYNEGDNLRPLLQEIFGQVPEGDIFIEDNHAPSLHRGGFCQKMASIEEK